MKDLQTLTDKQLYERCRMAGLNARKWQKAFAGLLPEVNRRGLYKKYNFGSIFEFAAKLAGMRKKVVLEILRVDRKLEQLPKLRQTFVSGNQGWTKVKAAASVAKPETDGLWAARVDSLPKGAIEELARKERKIEKPEPQTRRPGATLDFGFGNVDCDIKEEEQGEIEEKRSLTLQLDPQIYARLLELKNSLAKESKGPVDYNKVIEELLDGFNPKNKRLKKYTEIIHRCPDCQSLTLKTTSGDIKLEENDLEGREKIGDTIVLEEKKKEIEEELKTKEPSRYIPSKVKKIIQLEHGSKCAYPGCTKPAVSLHHIKRFALDKSQHPNSIKPLCAVHHHLAHASAIVGEEGDPCQWELSLEPTGSLEKRRVDRKVWGFLST